MSISAQKQSADTRYNDQMRIIAAIILAETLVCLSPGSAKGSAHFMPGKVGSSSMLYNSMVPLITTPFLGVPDLKSAIPAPMNTVWALTPVRILPITLSAPSARQAPSDPLWALRETIWQLAAPKADQSVILNRTFDCSEKKRYDDAPAVVGTRSTAASPLSMVSHKNTPTTPGTVPPMVMITYLSEVFTVRFNKNDGVEIKTSDLVASQVPTVKELASADQDGNGWVTAQEVLSTQGLSGSAYFAHEDLMNAARKRRFGAISVAGLRAKLIAGEKVAIPRPARLGRANANLAHLSRSAFVPLADHLASRLAGGASYESSYGNGEKIFHTDITDVWRGHAHHEVYAALSILAAREGGMEFGVSKSADGGIHLVQGLPEKLELDSAETGLDLILHTHPRSGADGARPSQGDFLAASEYDPDHIGRVASDDGWFAAYRSLKGNTSDAPKRLWAEQSAEVAVGRR